MHADNRFVKSSGKGNVKVSTVPHLVIERNFLRRESHLRRAETANGGPYPTNEMGERQRVSFAMKRDDVKKILSRAIIACITLIALELGTFNANVRSCRRKIVT